MATSTKRRVTRVGPKHRLWITLEQDTFEALQARGEKLGYSISALANRVILRGVAAGLIDDASPTTHELDAQLVSELTSLHMETSAILNDMIDLKNKVIAWQHQQLCEYSTAKYGPYKGEQAWRDAQAKIKQQESDDIPF